MNANGDSYCQLFNADYYAKKYYNMLKDWYATDDVTKCNTAARESEQCYRAYTPAADVEEFVYYKQQTNIYAELVNVESCVLNAYYPNFLDADDEYYESEDFSTILLLPFFFGLI